jgi:hypothetical protein
VRELLKKLRDYFERNSRVEQPEAPTGLGPVEEGLKFPGVGPVGPPPPPPGGRPVLKVQTFGRADNRFRFEIRARVGARQQACSVDVWVEPTMETGSAAKEDRFHLEDIVTVPANLPVQALPNGKFRFSIPPLPAHTQVRISGTTLAMAPEIFSVSEGLLKASLSSEGPPPEPEPVGEDTNA